MADMATHHLHDLWPGYTNSRIRIVHRSLCSSALTAVLWIPRQGELTVVKVDAMRAFIGSVGRAFEPAKGSGTWAAIDPGTLMWARAELASDRIAPERCIASYSMADAAPSPRTLCWEPPVAIMKPISNSGLAS